MAAPASVAVVICTRDRADSLARTLAAFDRLLDRDNVQLTVVDNGSSDGTAAMVSAWIARTDLDAQLISEPTPGLSRARNAGIAAADGELVAFTDDDCLPAEDFVSVLRSAFAEHPIDFCGGRIVAHDPNAARVALLLDASFRYFVPGRPIAAGAVQGANMAFRADVLRDSGRFDERMGAGTAFRCEDIELCARLLAAGHRGAHIPTLIIRHDHRRGPTEARTLERDNARARGAFLAKRIAAGDRTYLGLWTRSIHTNIGKHPRHLVRATRIATGELQGAVAWLWRSYLRPTRASILPSTGEPGSTTTA